MERKFWYTFLMIEFPVINPENVTSDEVNIYPVREASRAVVLDKNGMVALLHVTKESYYKLPGGGIEVGEDKISALHRECQEEIGCEIEVIGEVGSTIEYRKIFKLKQISYCYFAKVKGEKGTPNLDDGEIDAGFEQVWLPYEEALVALVNSTATSIEGNQYIVPRDTLLLTEAQKYLAGIG